MKPREIEVHIEELVLHGFPPGTRWEVAEAVASELRGVLTERGIPPAWQSSPERIEAGAIQAGPQTRPAATGRQIARAVHQGGAR
ncbi:MAG: hypothetical protein QOE70_860 [Chthoniobacter sp.]|jgi:hypothetical protein|nr:hypothetical protein [Chthoniobacter sp.]